MAETNLSVRDNDTIVNQTYHSCLVERISREARQMMGMINESVIKYVKNGKWGR